MLCAWVSWNISSHAKLIPYDLSPKSPQLKSVRMELILHRYLLRLLLWRGLRMISDGRSCWRSRWISSFRCGKFGSWLQILTRILRNLTIGKGYQARVKSVSQRLARSKIWEDPEKLKDLEKYLDSIENLVK
jgi:hypothetical protein